MTRHPLLSKLPSLRSLLPAAAAALVLGLFGWMADATRTYGLKPNPADHNYNLLVRGFQAGRLSLIQEVPAGFAQLADPFDPSANLGYRGPPYWLHDLSYYRGRLYLYFGITPALVLFWPWATLTGHYLFQQHAVAVFFAAGLLAGTGLLLGLRRRHFPDVGPAVAAAGVLVLGFATGIPILLQRAEFYEVAISCGCALTTLALAGVCIAIDRPARGVRWLAAASLAYGLAVGARPSVLFGAAILLVPVFLAWRERTGTGFRRIPWSLLAAAVIPLALCGLGLMLYNYLRFGSPSEFGQGYQLAAERNDPARHFSVRYLWFNFRIYFLEPSRWSTSFPFVRDIASPPMPPGHGQIEATFGVLANLPVLWLAIAAPLALRDRTGPARTALRAIAFSAALLFGACALVLCLFFGNCGRYEAEFLPGLAILAVIGIFGIERAFASRPPLRIAARVLWSLLLAFSVGYSLLESAHRHSGQIAKFAQWRVEVGQLREGIAEYEHALRISPENAEAQNNLANALAEIPGRMPEALAHYEQALRIDPDNAEAHYNFSIQLAKIPGRMPEALAHSEEALRINPNYAAAHCNYGNQLAGIPGRMPEAIAHYEEALRIDPDNFAAQNDIALAYAQTGRFDEAIAHFEQALRINPDHVAAQKNVAMAYAMTGRLDEAIAHFELALRLDPADSQAREKLDLLRSMRR